MKLPTVSGGACLALNAPGISWSALLSCCPVSCMSAHMGIITGPHTFGTTSDPEYAPLVHGNILGLTWFVLGVLIIPIVLPLRWGLIGPFSYVIPPLRKAVIQACFNPCNQSFLSSPSTWKNGIGYAGSCKNGSRVGRLAGLRKLACRAVSTAWLMQWYVVTAGMLVVNQVRTLAAHRYDNTGPRLSVAEQLLDSVNLCGWPVLTVLARTCGSPLPRVASPLTERPISQSRSAQSSVARDIASHVRLTADKGTRYSLGSPQSDTTDGPESQLFSV